MDEELRAKLDGSGYGRPGFAADYDRFRPQPPPVLRELLPQLAGVVRPRLVVDLGSGTGLSARFWADSAEEVVGIEPQEEMRKFAEQAAAASNVRYVAGSSYATGLPELSADIVTAAQSLQWMRPEHALPEVARILRDGGVFCAYNYVVLQTPTWEAEASFQAVRRRTRELLAQLGLDADTFGSPSATWLAESGVFRHTRELLLHSIEEGDGKRLVGFALSEGSTRTALDAGASEADLGLDRLRAAAAAMPQPVPWWIGYRVWVGLK